MARMAMTYIYAEMFRAGKTCSRGRADQSLRLRKYGNGRFLLEDEVCKVISSWRTVNS